MTWRNVVTKSEWGQQDSSIQLDEDGGDRQHKTELDEDMVCMWPVLHYYYYYYY